MPTYEYRCNDCDGLTEASRDVDDRDNPISCGGCQSNATIRVYNAVGIHFKGTGFYKTGG